MYVISTQASTSGISVVAWIMPCLGMIPGADSQKNMTAALKSHALSVGLTHFDVISRSHAGTLLLSNSIISEFHL